MPSLNTPTALACDFWCPWKRGRITTLRRDGTLLAEPGYDEASSLFVTTPALRDFPDRPTLSDARDAAKRLTELVSDFPFASSASSSAWLAGLLTVVVRHAFDGPAPMIVLDANSPGTGKSRLVDLIAVITTGRPMPRQPPSSDDAEQRKVITTAVQSGDAAVLIDNVVGALGGASLDAALTSEIWQDRLLGRNESIRLPLSVVFFASGNNLTLIGDLSRRCLYVRLETEHERPEERSDFRHLDILAHARKHRAEFLADALVILRAYFVAGRPPQQLRAYGSFEGWSSIVRASIVWAGLPDPCTTSAQIPSMRERESFALKAIMTALKDPGGTTAARLLEVAEKDTSLREALLEFAPARGNRDLPTAGSLGSKLHRVRGRVVDGRRIEQVGNSSPVRWVARTITPTGTSGACGTSLASLVVEAAEPLNRTPTTPTTPVTDARDEYEVAERAAIESETSVPGENQWMT